LVIIDKNITAPCGIIILAAGASKRLGQPKQLLPYHGKSLLQHAIQVAKETICKPIVVILGAHADALIKDASMPGIEVIINDEWEEGMASSIRKGLKKLMAALPVMDAIIFMVCDQPFVTAQLLEELILKHRETTRPVVACRYGNSYGTPALFHKTMFTQLLKLKGDKGAKKIMKEQPDYVVGVDFPLGDIDIDTMQDYESVLKKVDNLQ